MKFIHVADAHLDSPFLGLSFLPSKDFEQIKKSTEDSFERMVDYALQEKVDLVLIAGDTFDSVKPSPKIQIFFKNQIERLTNNKIQVIMIFGNHDYMSKDALFLQESNYFKILGADENVETCLFKTETKFPYYVSGFSYQHNHIKEDKIPNFEPKKNNKLHFGILHAAEKTTEREQNNYSPFKIRELKELNYDYFALGHIHLRQKLSEKPLIVYSGNLQGRHINERGKKGFYLGDFNENTNKLDLKFVSTAPIIWKMIVLNIAKEIKPALLIEKIRTKLKQENTRSTLFALKIKGAQFLNDEEIDLIQEPDFYQQVSENLEFSSKLVRIYLEQNEVIQLNNEDILAFEKAEDLTLNTETVLETGEDLSKKSEYIAKLLTDSNYINSVKELAKVKFGQKLKEFDNEAD